MVGFCLMPCLSPIQSQSLWQRLSHEQKQELRLMLSQKLLKDDFIGAKGLEGMKTAHKVLREHGESGILVGGLSKEIWNIRRKPADLEKHKDVDVLALGFSFNPSPFEGGIDWWLPQGPKEISYYVSDSSKVFETTAIWWENGNGVVMDFGIKDLCAQPKLEPGLYLPSPEWVISMRAQEMGTKVAYPVADGSLEVLVAKLTKTIGTALPSFIKETFDKFILHDDFSAHLPFYPSSKFNVVGFSKDKVSKLANKEFEGALDLRFV